MALEKSSNGNGHFKITDWQEKDVERKTAERCTIYLLVMLALFCWLLFDTWIGRHLLAVRLLGYDLVHLNSAGFRLIAFTVIAGGIGGAINGIRSINHYCDSFNSKHRWKYLAAPWMGSTLGLLVYALLRSSVSVLGGSVSSDSIGNTQVLANFAAGALAGYGSKDVFIWLDDKVHKIFQVTAPMENVTGKPQEMAISRLQAAQLEVGQVSQVPQKNGERPGTVVDQSPAPGSPIDRGQSVDLAVAAEGKAN